ncbi:MAG TPA: hypothetical protein VI299_26240 [Polyangiales bacterium]
MVASSPPPTRSQHAQRLGLLACVVVECLYIASFSPFPSVDSAAHLGSAWALADQLRHGGFASLLTWHFTPAPPNMLPSLALLGLAQGLGYQHAESALIAGYAAALAFALWWALHKLRTGADAFAFFALPLTFSFSLLYGFLNFSWSLVVLLMFAGVLLAERDEPLRPRRATLHLALLLALYGTHFVGWLVGGVLYGSWAAVRAVRRRELRTLITAGFALVPSALLVGWFLLQSRSAATDTLLSPLSKAVRIAGLEYGQLAYEKLERVAFVALAALFWTLALRRWRTAWKSPRELALRLTIAVTSALAIFGPEGTSSGAVQLAPRLGSIVALLGVLALGFRPPSRLEQHSAIWISVAAALWLAGVRNAPLRAIERGQSALLELAPQLRPHSTLLQANLARPHFGDTGRLDPLTAESGRLAAERALLDLANVDLALPYFLLRFRPEFNPWSALLHGTANIEDSPPPLDLRATPIPIDYLVLLGRPFASDQDRTSSTWLAFDAQLRAGFEHVQTTGDGLWELWRAR